MASRTKVFVIDAQGVLGSALAALLKQYEIDVRTYRSVTAFINATAIRSEDRSSTHERCLLLALDAECEDGLPVVENIHSAYPALPLIVFCDTPSDDLRTQYIEAGAIDIVSKSMADAYAFTRLSAILPTAPGLPTTPKSTVKIAEDISVTLRMLTPDDWQMERDFVVALSHRSKYLRFFSGFKEPTDYMLRTLVNVQFPASYAVVATVPADGGKELQIGVARYAPTEMDAVAEFAVVVADEWQGRGIASALLRGVITTATVAGIYRLEGMVLRENTGMLRLVKKLGFSLKAESGASPGAVMVYRELR